MYARRPQPAAECVRVGERESHGGGREQREREGEREGGRVHATHGQTRRLVRTVCRRKKRERARERVGGKGREGKGAGERDREREHVPVHCFQHVRVRERGSRKQAVGMGGWYSGV